MSDAGEHTKFKFAGLQVGEQAERKKGERFKSAGYLRVFFKDGKKDRRLSMRVYVETKGYKGA